MSDLIIKEYKDSDRHYTITYNKDTTKFVLKDEQLDIILDHSIGSIYYVMQTYEKLVRY